MVNKHLIERDLHWYFQDANTELPLYEDQYEIDDQGLVHVIGTDIQRNRVSLTGLLPVQFGEVDGDFLVDEMNLKSLKGAPIRVWGRFSCNRNQLTHLAHAPAACEDFSCSHNKLVNLTHAPQVANTITCDHNMLTDLAECPPAKEVFAAYNPFVHFKHTPDHIEQLTITYEVNLPLLGLLSVHHVEIFDPDTGEYMEPLSQILNNHTGKGAHNKAQMLKCAAELIKAGYKDNARW